MCIYIYIYIIAITIDSHNVSPLIETATNDSHYDYRCNTATTNYSFILATYCRLTIIAMLAIKLLYICIYNNTLKHRALWSPE